MIDVKILLVLGCLLCAVCIEGQVLPTVYEYYTEGGINSGLEALPGQFKLNGKDITLYSGSIHYFRMVPEYWRDRLRRMRAAGLNAIDVYAPWNLHEPRKGVFDFGNGDEDFSKVLNIRQFLQIAQEEDLLVILRPGPYICSEWEFGGLPSWLLRYPDIKVRTSDPVFTGHVRQYFDQLLAQVVDLQFTRGGSIIAVQIENEYGSFGPYDEIKDRDYLAFIRDAYVQNGINELLLTCDSPALVGDTGSLPGYLMTANFDNNPATQFDRLLELQPDKPLMAMEFWSGWFDYWFGVHTGGLSPENFAEHLTTIFSYNASVNFYMFHGGSTYGFMNGANKIPVFPGYLSDVSSYDYSAPLSEAGDYTEKYNITKDLIALDNEVLTLTPAQPPNNPKTAYPALQIQQFLTYDQIIQQIPLQLKTQIPTVINMEALEINDGNGQSYGLTVYRKQLDLPTLAELQIVGHIRDVAMVVVDGVQKTKKPQGSGALLGFGFWTNRNSTFAIEGAAAGLNTLDVVVENWGRVNFGGPAYFEQKKGLFEGPLLVDGVELTDLEAIPLELKSKWIKSLTGWQAFEVNQNMTGPVLLRATFDLSEPPQDTFLDMSAWGRGSIFVNGFHMGRFFHVGPQITTYIPAPLLLQGTNEIIIFEHYLAADELTFSDVPILGRN
ncbi:beta-galactosidase-1-like protein 2 [Neocloeon triangulifer]|uniref:beta-galactosidase-1-like protein 2 n=1 Tax=Neocloeon triangulifer TaxID=2078957 RepID=UPI00286EF6EF|nr:beta-galactosidase-1-like protein 2 [Neocloeon triangulifer]